jgi:4-carboxymuconolactone decarboxylase
MRKLVVLYGHPTDPDHFRRYYTGTHLPLAARLPGLLAMRHSFAPEGVGGPSPYFCIFEGEFADAASLGAAMASPEGRALAADAANYATGGVTILHGEPEEGLVRGISPEPEPSPPALGADPRTGADVFAAGLDVRRAMFGPAGADAQIEAATDFLKPMQDLVTRYCFGDVWTRPGLPRKTRSLLTLSMLVVLGRPNQLKVHVRGALANGATEEEIRETLLHAMIYAGVPASVDAFLNAAEVLREVGAHGKD